MLPTRRTKSRLKACALAQNSQGEHQNKSRQPFREFHWGGGEIEHTRKFTMYFGSEGGRRGKASQHTVAGSRKMGLRILVHAFPLRNKQKIKVNVWAHQPKNTENRMQRGFGRKKQDAGKKLCREWISWVVKMQLQCRETVTAGLAVLSKRKRTDIGGRRIPASP